MKSAADPPSPAPSDGPSDAALTPRLERLRALRSAWGVLSPNVLDQRGEEIAETGRALTDHLSKVMNSENEIGSDILGGLDTLLEEFETSIRRVAVDVPISQLRSTLPAYRENDRRGLLDLLDVMLGQDPWFESPPTDRIGVVDYLITLLCTRPGGSVGQIGHDPVRLTPRLEALCESSDLPDDARLAEVEAEFFAASNLDGEDLRQELQQRRLRGRKGELGMAFFAPRVLRAIVTYNAALLVRVADEIVDSGDWGLVEGDPGSVVRRPTGSVFASRPLRALAAAVRRRLAGEAAEPTAIDRIACALDLDYLEDAERRALDNPALATREDTLGTTILVGLMSRSLAVLSIDLQEAGFSPDEISDAWIAELDGIFQQEISQHIAGDGYKLACALSELKTKFLFAPLADQFREHKATQRPPTRKLVEAKPVWSPEPEESGSAKGHESDRPASPRRGENARDLVRHALEADDRARSGRRERTRFGQIPWATIGQGAAALALAFAVAVFFLAGPNRDLDRLDREQLQQVSPYLSQGKRDGAGAGRSFVGRVADRWLTLPIEEREAIADEIVTRLRERGMQQIMIYDDDGRIRIQALGSQPTRVL